jgi:hypothetical protein
MMNMVILSGTQGINSSELNYCLANRKEEGEGMSDVKGYILHTWYNIT